MHGLAVAEQADVDATAAPAHVADLGEGDRFGAPAPTGDEHDALIGHHETLAPLPDERKDKPPEHDEEPDTDDSVADTRVHASGIHPPDEHPEQGGRDDQLKEGIDHAAQRRRHVRQDDFSPTELDLCHGQEINRSYAGASRRPWSS